MVEVAVSIWTRRTQERCTVSPEGMQPSFRSNQSLPWNHAALCTRASSVLTRAVVPFWTALGGGGIGVIAKVRVLTVTVPGGTPVIENSQIVLPLNHALTMYIVVDELSV